VSPLAHENGSCGVGTGSCLREAAQGPTRKNVKGASCGDWGGTGSCLAGVGDVFVDDARKNIDYFI
jgi:hypothetical protein